MKRAALGLCLATFAACGVAPDHSPPTESAALSGALESVILTHHVRLRVVTPDGQPIPFARVTPTLEHPSVLTDSDGVAVFSNFPYGRFLAKIEADGFASAVASLDYQIDGNAKDELRLLPLGEPILVDADKGAVLERDGVRVELPPHSLVDSHGDVVTGTITATLVPFDSTQRPVDDFPGPLNAETYDEQEVLLSSVTMAEISFWRGEEYLQLAPGKTARLTFDLPPSVAAHMRPGDTIPAWWLDLDTGVWREEGNGTIVYDFDDSLVWQVDFHHFSWHNCDLAIDWNQMECFVITTLDASGNIVPGNKFTLQSDSIGTFVDGGTTLLTTTNQLTNCAHAEYGTLPTLKFDSGLSVPLLSLTSFKGTPSTCANPEDDDYEENKPNPLEGCTKVIITLPVGY